MLLVLAALQKEGDNAKLSDAFYAVLALTKHFKAISREQGSLVNFLRDNVTPLSTLQVLHSFSKEFLRQACYLGAPCEGCLQ